MSDTPERSLGVKEGAVEAKSNGEIKLTLVWLDAESEECGTYKFFAKKQALAFLHLGAVFDTPRPDGPSDSSGVHA